MVWKQSVIIGTLICDRSNPVASRGGCAIGEDAQSVGFHARHTLTALNDRRLNESRCKWRELTTQDTRERGGNRRILNSKFLDYRCSICSTSLASRHVAAIGFPPLKYVVCGDVKVRDECVACVIPT